MRGKGRTDETRRSGGREREMKSNHAVCAPQQQQQQQLIVSSQRNVCKVQCTYGVGDGNRGRRGGGRDGMKRRAMRVIVAATVVPAESSPLSSSSPPSSPSLESASTTKKAARVPVPTYVNLHKPHEWRAFMDAMRWFVREHGHALVPRLYKLPEEAGTDTGGGDTTNLADFPLGSRSMMLRRKGGWIFYNEERYGTTRITELRDVGFVFDVAEYTFESVLVPALRWFKAEHKGNLLMPTTYVVPKDCENVPPQCRGLRLGNLCSRIRCKPETLNIDASAEKRLILENLDFPFDKVDYLFRNKTLPALLWYKHRFGHLLINTRFEMPSDDESVPDMCRGYRLGPCVNKIRVRGDYVRDSDERREILERCATQIRVHSFVFMYR